MKKITFLIVALFILSCIPAFGQSVSPPVTKWSKITLKPEITVGDTGYLTFSAAVTAIGSTSATLVIPSGNHVAGGVTVPANVQLRPVKGALFTIANGATFTVNGTLDAGPYQIFSCTGTGKVVFGTGAVKETHPEWWANNTTPGTTDMYAALQAAIIATQNVIGTLRLQDYTYATETTLLLTAPNLLIKGSGVNSIIKYTGAATTTYLIYGDYAATENIVFEDVKLVGGEYKAGKVIWVLFMRYWARGCDLRNVIIREGLGLVNFQLTTYGRITSAQLIQTVPDPETQGWSKADWDLVYVTGSAPVYFGGTGGNFKIDQLSLQKVGSETHSGVTGANIIYFNLIGEINSLTIETSGVEYTAETITYSTSTNYIIRSVDSLLQLDSLYFEAVGAVSGGIYNSGNGGVTLTKPFIYDFRGGTSCALFINDSVMDMVVRDGKFYGIDAKRMSRIATSLGGNTGTIVYENCLTATGLRYTVAVVDGGPNAYTYNVYDTKDCVNVLGLEDSGLNPYPRQAYFPEKLLGMVVTNSSDATGHFVQITGGIFQNDRRELKSCKLPTSTSATTFVVYRLRPLTASQYCRIYVGAAGNLYITEQAGAFSDDQGNWIAGFTTGADMSIGSLAANPRLAIRGIYINSRPIISSTAAPGSGNWEAGARVQNQAPASAAPPGWYCTVAGAPGTWVAEPNLP